MPETPVAEPSVKRGSGTTNNVSDITRPLVIGQKFRNDTTIASFVLYKNKEFKESESVEKTQIEIDYDYINNHEIKVITPVNLKNGQKTFEGIPTGTIPVLEVGNPSVINSDSSSSGNYFGVFNNIMITDIAESHSSIQKIHLNFSNSWNVFFFNNNPVMITVSGHFLDTELNPYYQEFMIAYEKYLSATELSAGGTKLILTIDGKIMEGYILNVSVSTSAQLESLKSFQMTFLVKKTSWIRLNRVRNDTNPYFKVSNPVEENINAIGNKGRVRMDTGYKESKDYMDLLASMQVPPAEEVVPTYPGYPQGFESKVVQKERKKRGR